MAAVVPTVELAVNAADLSAHRTADGASVGTAVKPTVDAADGEAVFPTIDTTDDAADLTADRTADRSVGTPVVCTVSAAHRSAVLSTIVEAFDGPD
jgi:hypothetical protein